MSVILDALKKLDREKSIRQHAIANIAAEILRPDLPRPEKKFSRYFVTVFFTAVAAAMVTYVTTVYFPPKSPPPAPVASSALNQRGTPAPMEYNLPLKSSVPAAVNPPVSDQQAKPTPTSREAVQEVQDGINRKSPKASTPAESKITDDSKPAVTSMDERKPKPNIIREGAEVAPSIVKKVPEQTTSGSPANPPVLKISAIVWFEDPAMRFAMINGLKATEGSIIEGIRVVEINPTSVRFLHKEQYFEIFLNR